MEFRMDRRYVQAAFFQGAVLPPPSAGPEVFTRADCAGARGAADAYEPLVVQGVIWNIVPVDVCFDRSGIPEKQRIIFDDFVGVVPFRDAMVLPVRGVLRA